MRQNDTTTAPGREGRERAVTRDRWFHDEHGRLAVVQSPNAPIIVWAASRLLGMVVTHGAPGRLMDTLAFGALFTWAWLELTDGSAYVRRVLGLVVLVALVVSRVR